MQFNFFKYGHERIVKHYFSFIVEVQTKFGNLYATICNHFQFNRHTDSGRKENLILNFMQIQHILCENKDRHKLGQCISEWEIN